MERTIATDTWHCWCCGSLIIAEGEADVREDQEYECPDCNEVSLGDELIPGAVMAQSPCDVEDD